MSGWGIAAVLLTPPGLWFTVGLLALIPLAIIGHFTKS